MFSEISRSYGKIYPKQEILAHQIAPHRYPPQGGYKQTVMNSQLLGLPVAIWSLAHSDLKRICKLIVNGDVVFDASKEITPSVEKRFDIILSATQDDVETAMGVVNILQQYMKSASLDLVGVKKGFTKSLRFTLMPDEGQMAHSLEVKKDSFKIIQEQVYKTISILKPEDTQQYHFWKIKTVVSGKLNDLKNGNAKALSHKVVYTKERPSRDAALKAKYIPTGIGIHADKETLFG